MADFRAWEVLVMVHTDLWSIVTGGLGLECGNESEMEDSTH